MSSSSSSPSHLRPTAKAVPCADQPPPPQQQGTASSSPSFATTMPATQPPLPQCLLASARRDTVRSLYEAIRNLREPHPLDPAHHNTLLRLRQDAERLELQLKDAPAAELQLAATTVHSLSQHLDQCLALARLARLLDTTVADRANVQVFLECWTKLDFVGVRSSCVGWPHAAQLVAEAVLTQFPAKLYECHNSAVPSITFALWLDAIMTAALEAQLQQTAFEQHRYVLDSAHVSAFLMQCSMVVHLIVHHLPAADAARQEAWYVVASFCHHYLTYAARRAVHM